MSKVKTRLLMITPWDRHGIAGVERVVINLSEGLRNEFDIHIVATSSREVERPSGLSADIKFTPMSGRARQLVGKLRKIIKSEQPNIILAHVPHLIVAIWLASYCIGRQVRQVGVNHAATVLSWRDTFMTWLSYLVSDTFIAVSKDIRTRMSRLPFVKSEGIQVIYNGLDIAAVQAKAKEFTAEKPHGVKRLVAIGRLSEQKGFDILLDAFAQMVNQTSQPFELQLVGDGPLRSQLEEQAMRLDISEQVQFLGWQDNPYPYLASADLFVLSSRFEGFGLVLVEALALGVPIVSTDCPSGPNEILVDGQYGTLVPVSDSEALASAISTATAADISSTPLQYRAETFSSTGMVELYRQFLVSK